MRVVDLIEKKKESKLEKNEYYRDYDFMFVQNTENHLVSSKQEIYNICVIEKVAIPK